MSMEGLKCTEMQRDMLWIDRQPKCLQVMSVIGRSESGLDEVGGLGLHRGQV